MATNKATGPMMARARAAVTAPTELTARGWPRPTHFAMVGTIGGRQ
jgi:hypothetical protein